VFTTLIGTSDLAERVGVTDDLSWVVVDVRHDLAQPDAWGNDAYRKGHISGARFAHLDRDLSATKTGTRFWCVRRAVMRPHSRGFTS